MASSDPEKFSDEFAQYLLERLGTDTLPRDERCFVFCSQNGKMSINKHFMAYYDMRNPARQTYLYCLLRFTLKQEYRDLFIRSATADQLATQNIECGSAAISGHFLGQIERLAAGIREPRTDVNTQLNSIKVQFGKAAFEDFMDIINRNGENAWQIARTLERKMFEDRCKELKENKDGLWLPW